LHGDKFFEMTTSPPPANGGGRLQSPTRACCKAVP
jgi:hypothetical protein